MIVYPAEYNDRKESAFASVIAATGGAGRRLPFIGLSFRDLPETDTRTDEALSRAKRQPTGKVARRLKAALIRAQYNWSRRYFAARPGAVAMSWNGLTGSRRAFMMGARDAGARTLFLELAPFPGRLTMDMNGVNAEGSVPDEPGFFRRWAGEDPDRTGDGWRRLGENLTARTSRRSDVGQTDSQGLGPEAYLFVPLQVPDDSQMRIFASWSGGLDGFTAAMGRAARSLPEGWHVRMKEHPSARQSVRAQIDAANAASGGRIVLDNATDSFAQLTASRGVVTINSSMGLQAFFHDKPVLVSGHAFWSMPGLTEAAASEAALGQHLTSPDDLSFVPDLRAAFMNWLDQVYYPRLVEPDRDWAVDPNAVRTLLAR